MSPWYTTPFSFCCYNETRLMLLIQRVGVTQIIICKDQPFFLRLRPCWHSSQREKLLGWSHGRNTTHTHILRYTHAGSAPHTFTQCRLLSSSSNHLHFVPTPRIISLPCFCPSRRK
ncbi:unnamed protein product [Amoebophrya sp. A25]|nr:unnamed protein product [Amoebophrya sp. A25]|eukprot:GSA25T00011883001.1